MNSELNTVSQVAGWDGVVPITPRWPLQSTVCEKPAAASAQWRPKWVSS